MPGLSDTPFFKSLSTLSPAKWFLEAFYYRELQASAFDDKYELDKYGRIPGTVEKTQLILIMITIAWIFVSLFSMYLKR